MQPLIFTWASRGYESPSGRTVPSGGKPGTLCSTPHPRFETIRPEEVSAWAGKGFNENAMRNFSWPPLTYQTNPRNKNTMMNTLGLIFMTVCMSVLGTHTIPPEYALINSYFSPFFTFNMLKPNIDIRF